MSIERNFNFQMLLTDCKRCLTGSQKTEMQIHFFLESLREQPLLLCTQIHASTKICIDNVLTNIHTACSMTQVVTTPCSLVSVDMMCILAYICSDVKMLPLLMLYVNDMAIHMKTLSLEFLQNRQLVFVIYRNRGIMQEMKTRLNEK